MRQHDIIPMFSSLDSKFDIDLISPIKRVLERKWYILGEEVKFLRENFLFTSV
jgi:hypothetical protein